MRTEAQPTPVDQTMAERYGTDRSPWPTRLVVGGMVALFLSTAIWVGINIVDRPFEGKVIRSTPISERIVSVDLQLRGESTTPVTCVVRVKDASASDVGYANVTFPRAPQTRTFRIATVVRASSVEILGCAAAGEDLQVAPADYPPGVVPEPTRPIE